MTLSSDLNKRGERRDGRMKADQDSEQALHQEEFQVHRETSLHLLEFSG